MKKPHMYSVGEKTMPMAHYKFGGFNVEVDLSSIGIVSCEPPTIEVCGYVSTEDGMFSRYICTQIVNSKSFIEALKKLREELEEKYCGDADEPEQCIEYYSDMFIEMACESIDPEYIIPYVEMEELVEALVNAARDFMPSRKKTLLDYMNR